MAETLATATHERAQRALLNSPIHALRELRVEQVDDALVLSGCVQTFYHKQLAQELVRTVADECELVNSVDVRYVHRVCD
jgi:hypothetical protein